MLENEANNHKDDKDDHDEMEKILLIFRIT